MSLVGLASSRGDVLQPWLTASARATGVRAAAQRISAPLASISLGSVAVCLAAAMTGMAVCLHVRRCQACSSPVCASSLTCALLPAFPAPTACHEARMCLGSRQWLAWLPCVRVLCDCYGWHGFLPACLRVQRCQACSSPVCASSLTCALLPAFAAPTACRVARVS